jgi:hypothetical protein
MPDNTQVHVTINVARGVSLQIESVAKVYGDSIAEPIAKLGLNLALEKIVVEVRTGTGRCGHDGDSLIILVTVNGTMEVGADMILKVATETLRRQAAISGLSEPMTATLLVSGNHIGSDRERYILEPIMS